MQQRYRCSWRLAVTCSIDLDRSNERGVRGITLLMMHFRRCVPGYPLEQNIVPKTDSMGLICAIFFTAAAQLGDFRATSGRRSECHFGMCGLWAPALVRWAIFFPLGALLALERIQHSVSIQWISGGASRGLTSDAMAKGPQRGGCSVRTISPTTKITFTACHCCCP